MSAFHYSAVDFEGKRRKGVLEADSVRQVREQLRDLGLMPIDVSMVQEHTARFHRRLNAVDVALCTRQLATLLSAALPLDEVLTAVAAQAEKSHIKSIFLGLRSSVLEGHSLAYAMDKFPKSFSKLYRTTISAGERSGKLEVALEELAEYTEKQHRIKQKIRQALVYPSLMTLVATSVVLFLVTYIVPKIVQTFSSVGQALPFETVLLLNISYVLKTYGGYLCIVLIGILYGIHYFLKIERIRFLVEGYVMRAPILGKTIKRINTARFARTLGILILADVPMLESMQAANQLVQPLPMRKAIAHAIEQVREGAPLYQALQATRYFSPMFIHLMASGERSGQLEKMLQKAASQQETDVDALIQTILTLFEPVLILLMGGIVLFIVLAIMLPIFSMDQMV